MIEQVRYSVRRRWYAAALLIIGLAVVLSITRPAP